MATVRIRAGTISNAIANNVIIELAAWALGKLSEVTLTGWASNAGLGRSTSNLISSSMARPESTMPANTSAARQRR